MAITPEGYKVAPSYTRGAVQIGNRQIGKGPSGPISSPVYGVRDIPSTFRKDLPESTARLNRGRSGYGTGRAAPRAAIPGPTQRQWVPIQQRPTSRTRTTTRDIGALPELPEFAELDKDAVKSRTQEFSALGRREARQSFTDLLSRIYGATPGDPYAQNLARTASRGFSLDTQRAIDVGGKRALTMGLEEQQVRNARRMMAYSAAVQAAIAGATTTSTEKTQYEDVPTKFALGPPPSSAVVNPMLSGTPPNIALTQPYTWG